MYSKHKSIKKKSKSKSKKKYAGRKRNFTSKQTNIEIVKPQQQMACNLALKKKKITQSSCYTPDVLAKIKDAYNKAHPTTQILATDPLVVWKELKTKLNCGKEDCWLHQIKDESLRNKLDTYIFAPDAPPKWKLNPIEWLSNYDIDNVISQYEAEYPHFVLLGPSPIDFDTVINNTCVEQSICSISLQEMISKKKTHIGFVFNLDKHNQPGSHWVSMFVDIANQYIFYFDSAGDGPSKEVVALKNKLVEQGKQLSNPIVFKYYDNEGRDHQKHNTECGVYSIYFIITMLTGIPVGSQNAKPLSIQKRIHLFKHENLKDDVMIKCRQLLFNLPN